jgi:spermidine/putrescine-binding protein
VTSQLVRLIEHRHPDLTVKVSTYTNGEGALIAVRTSPPDVVEVRSDESAPRLADLGLLRPLDTTRITSWSKLLPAFATLPGVRVASNTYMVPTEAEVVGIVYRKDKVTQPPASFADLFLRRFKGKVAAPDNPAVAIESAALALHLPDPLALSEAEFTRVKILLKANGGAQFGGFYDGASGLHRLLRGPAVVGIASLADALAVQRSGLPIAFRPAIEGQLVRVRGYAIASSCTDVDKAYAVLQALAGKEAERLVTRAGELAVNGSTPVPRRLGAGVLFTPKALTNAVAIAPVDDRPGWIQTWYEVKAGRG